MRNGQNNEDIYVSNFDRNGEWAAASEIGVDGGLLYRAVTEEENISRLNYRVNDYIDYLDGDLESSIFYSSDRSRGSVYDEIIENSYLAVLNEPQSTFSIDVDGASYSDVRGYINRNQLPNRNAVRLEEFVNYFPYSYPEPSGEHPFSINTEMGATLFTIAKDVKIQVEFNPVHVGSYRLLGYENRLLENADFANDTVDAGELGEGHTVTAVYEIIPAGNEEASSDSTGLRYSHEMNSLGHHVDEFATVKFRYKEPDGDKSKLIKEVIYDIETATSGDFEFVQAVLEYGLLIRESEFRGTANFDHIIEQTIQSKGNDPFGYRSEFIKIVEKTQIIWDGDNIE